MIQQKEQLLIKFSEIEHLILQKILIMIDIKEDWLLWYTMLLIKNQKDVSLLIIGLSKIYN